MVNALREDVRRWRESGWENASKTTKKRRNQLVAALADEACIVHTPPGDHVARLLA